MKGLDGDLLDVILFRRLLGVWISSFEFLRFSQELCSPQKLGLLPLTKVTQKGLGRVEMYERSHPFVTNVTTFGLQKKSRRQLLCHFQW
jgi:hypothetical protein